ncbi:MAG: pitrilysin family protein [Spongiibacteraceae bacterium]
MTNLVHTRRPRMVLMTLLACLAAISATVHAEPVDIPYQKFILDNGLTLIVHEDRKAPLVAVDIWYHVGSKNEKAGQTGFAHLFEHLMFNGSEHFNDEYFRPFEKAGATDMNGTTNNDRTNYFATVPKPALDMALWMESDRMAHLLPAIDQAKLDEQRGVVKNEKRQREDRPFGKVYELIARNTYPVGHPYSWPVIGSMQDLDAASLDDVHNWFKNYYGPNNAVLVIAGDIDAKAVKERVDFYFGSIPPNPPYERAQTWIAKRNEERRDAMQDRVPNPRIYLVWNTPQFTDPVSDRLDIAADLLAGDASAVLTQQLVQKEKLATTINAGASAGEIAGQFWIQADVAPGVDPLQLEKRLRAVLEQFKRSGPTPDALARAKTTYRANVLRQLEKLGGFGGKADVLATGAVFANDAGYFRQQLQHVATATPEQIRSTVQTWLDSGVYVLHVTPYPTLKTHSDTVDRSQVPSAGVAPTPNLPAIERAQLDNGLQLVLVHRGDLPLVEMELQLPFGFNVDGLQNAGTANFAMNMLTESSVGLDSAMIAANTRKLGAEIDSYARLDSSGVQLSALKENIDASTALFAHIIRQPDFATDALQQLQKKTLAQIQREQNDGNSLAQRVMPRLLFGDSSPNAGPFTGSGRSDVVANLSREKLQEFHRRWFDPAQATLIATGDLDLQQFKTLAQKYFGDWKATSENINTPTTIAATPTHGTKPAIYLVDLPGSAQATISGSLLLPPSQQIDMRALALANNALGGLFTSRINMNLREEKHWSYGTRSSIVESRGPQVWIAMGGVQIDKTGPALDELKREWQEFIDAHPLTQEEFEKAREQRVRQLPGAYETNSGVLQAVAKNLRLQRPDNYLAEENEKLMQLDLTTVQGAAQHLKSNNAVWLVIGDKQKIWPQLQALKWGDIIELDKNGEPIR